MSSLALMCIGLTVIFIALNGFREPEVIPVFNLVAVSAPMLMRFAKKHPLFRSTYRDWLKTTPWQPDQPLPLGDVMLEFQDFVALGLATGLSFQSPLRFALLVPIGFCVLHLTMVLASLSITKIKVEMYGLLFAIVAMLWLIPNTVLVLIALLALEPLKRRGHRRSLESFPWDHIENLPVEGWKKKTRVESKLGHYQLLRSNMNITEPDRTETLTQATLVGFVGLAVAAHLPRVFFDLPPSSLEMVVLFRGFFAALPVAFAIMWVVIYKASYRSPIDLFGRLWTRRFILPRHDRVYIVPILLLFLACVFTALIPLAPALVFALGWWLSCWILSTGRPTLREWVYTGHIRTPLPTVS